VNGAALKLPVALALLGASALLADAMRSTSAAVSAPDGEARAGDEGARAGDAGADARHAARGDEALAAALRPLGPVRTIISSALWTQLTHGQARGDAEAAATLARALLALNPGLATVREYLAGQLLVTEAPRAPDRARHDALVATGLALFEDGLALPGGAVLHAPFGRALAVQSMSGVDDRFAAAAEAWLGEMPEERALTELLASGPVGFDRWLAGSLAVQRGLAAWLLDGDRGAAQRDLSLARSLVPADDGMAAGAGESSADETRERAQRLLEPLVEALRSDAPPRRPAPDGDAR